MVETDDEPLTLADACHVIFGDKITPSSLRAEAKRGRLTIERIGRTDFVTRAAIREMRRKCVLAPHQRDQGSGSGQPASAPEGRRSEPSGSSATTADTLIARDSAMLIVAELKKPSKITSPRSTARRPDNVIPLKG